MKAILPALLSVLIPILLPAQSRVQVPAFTGYSMPVSGQWSDKEGMRFSGKGVTGWTNPERSLNFYGKVKKRGSLEFSVAIRTPQRTRFAVEVNGKQFVVDQPASDSFVYLKIPAVKVDTGFIHLSIRPQLPTQRFTAEVRDFVVEGAAAEGIHFNFKERKNAASVHLRYPFPAKEKVTAFYNEITVPEGADPIHSYYMACGFARGYFGIQVNSPTERRVIFSVWDSGNEAVDRNKVGAEDRVLLLRKGEAVHADGFGNEGTGGHSHLVYNWKTGNTYGFLVTAEVDSIGNATIYTGYFYSPEENKWILIASFRAPKDGQYLRGLYSFVENFWGSSGHLERRAFYGNQYICNEKGEWIELTEAIFSYDQTGRLGDRLDYGAGVDRNRFFLTNGGFKASISAPGDSYRRTNSSQKPVSLLTPRP